MIAAKHLKDLRLQHNYTQEYLALSLDISQKSYSNLEKGEKKITLDLLSKIAACYEIDTINLVQKLTVVNSDFIGNLKKEQPKKSEMEIHHGINENLQLDYINSLQSRINDLQTIISLKDKEIERLQKKA